MKCLYIVEVAAGRRDRDCDVDVGRSAREQGENALEFGNANQLRRLCSLGYGHLLQQSCGRPQEDVVLGIEPVAFAHLPPLCTEVWTSPNPAMS